MRFVDLTSCAAGIVAVLVLPALTLGAPAQLPWQREMPLREAARSVALQSVLDSTNPQPDWGGAPFGGPSMVISNLKMRSTIWGLPERVTVSVTKNDVWDRRLHEFRPPTLQEIIDGAYSPINKDYVGVGGNSLRPIDLGWLRKEGGPYDPYRRPMRYAFPSLKPVGQIIVGIDELAGADPPTLSQNCDSGLVTLKEAKGAAKVTLQYVLGMTGNTYAIRGQVSGVTKPISLWLYRHQDTSHLMYMTADGKRYTNPAAEADKAFNGPIDPPTSGQDGRYFWVRQKMPPEKTFPSGFEYVLMGLVTSPSEVKLESVEGKTHLGTPPRNQRLNGEWKNVMRPAIADAPGAAATAILAPSDGKFETLVTVVTTSDGADIMTIAKQRLAKIASGGFEGVLRENVKWWNDFYDRREEGRVFYASSGRDCTDDIRAIYRSWTCNHGGGTKTDMRRFEASASYALPERDFQEWDSAPCYNEIFHTSRFVRNWGDSVDMYKQLVWHWLPGARQNARDMFGMPGMLISHGYLPPVKPDKYVHTTITLELCLGTMAQIMRPVWDEWDYGGDVTFLREQCYPLMREMALFYAAYAKLGRDGYYHVIPSMEEERWGIYPRFARNKDVISSLCMFRWGLTRAADAAEFQGVDAELRRQWRQVAAKIAPYPTWKKPQGVIFAGMPGVEPMHLPGDHFGDAAAYPTILADQINLDSPKEQREMMIRSVTTLRSGSAAEALLLLGQPENATGARRRPSGGDAEALLNSRSGRIHLFPAVAPTAEVAFHHFQARGGFLVSAARNADGVYYVEIQPRRDNQCRLMNPWPGKSVFVHEVDKTERVAVSIDRTNGECIEFAAAAGHAYRVEQQ